MNANDIPELPGYVSVARAAKIFGLAKPSIYWKIYTQEAFRHVWRLAGAESDGGRSVLLLLEAEVLAVAAREKAEAQARAAAAGAGSITVRLNAWNKRVKQWGVDTGWTETVINNAGQPHLQLREAYLRQHPEDARPE